MNIVVDLRPGPYRFELARGMSDGTDIAALQINLNEAGFPCGAVDGVFKDQTEAAVIAAQRIFWPDDTTNQDGVVGQMTFRRLCLVLITTGFQTYRTPGGLMDGQTAGESGFVFGCWSRHSPSRSDPDAIGFDWGGLQEAFGPDFLAPTQANLIRAANMRQMALKTCGEIRSRKDDYFNRPWVAQQGSLRQQWAWQLAAYGHNQPAYAAAVASTGLMRPSDPGWEDRPATWVEVASGGRLHTPREWMHNYISSTTHRVRSYTP